MSTEGVSFLYQFDLGNRDIINPGVNILSVTGTAAGDFDKANLTTDALRQVWRSAESLNWQEIVIKADRKSKIDTFAILGHNFSETAVIQIQANIADNWVAPPANYSVPWTKYNIVLCQDFMAQYEYYRVRILDPANPCGYIQIGRIIGGQAFTMTNNEDITDDIELSTDDLADKMPTEGFFRFSNERVKQRSVSMRFQKLQSAPPDNENYTGLVTMLDVVGETKTFLVIVDRTDPGFISMWGQLDKVPSLSFTINRFVSLPMRVVEVF